MSYYISPGQLLLLLSQSDTATQLQICRPHKLLLEAPSAHKLCVWSFLKWVSMTDQQHAGLTSPYWMPVAGWSGVKHAGSGLWSSWKVFVGGWITPHYLAVYLQEHGAYTLKFGWGEITGLRLFFGVWAPQSSAWLGPCAQTEVREVFA